MISDRAEVSHFVYDNAGQILAKYDDGKASARDRIDYLHAQGNPVAETGTAIEGGAYTLIDAKNYALIQQDSKEFPGGSMMSYTVNGDGETLQSIANSMYGNPGLWYLLADANGLSGSRTLKAGQVLAVPSNTGNGPIDGATHKTYNENEIVGSRLPNLQAPPPKKKSCSGLLMILVIIGILFTCSWEPELGLGIKL